MCLSLQNTSSVGVKDNNPRAEEMQRDEGELADQSNKEEIDKEESECMLFHYINYMELGICSIQEIAECLQQSLESALPSIYGR